MFESNHYVMNNLTVKASLHHQRQLVTLALHTRPHIVSIMSLIDFKTYRCGSAYHRNREHLNMKYYMPRFVIVCVCACVCVCEAHTHTHIQTHTHSKHTHTRTHTHTHTLTQKQCNPIRTEIQQHMLNFHAFLALG